MKGLKHFFDFGTDLLLFSFLMVLMGVVFLSAINLTPAAIDFSKGKEVLGASTELSGDGLEISPDLGTDASITLKLESQDENSLKLAFNTEKLAKGEHSKKLAGVTNAGTITTKFFFKLDLAEKYLAGMRYDLVAGGKNFVIYDDRNEKLTRDYEITVESGQSIDLTLKITAYTAPAYSINGVAGINSGLKTLP